MTSSTTKPTTTFWILSVLALLWNTVGAITFILQVTMTPETLKALPPEQQAMYTGIPSWVTGAYALAVWGGVLACTLLLLRKKLAESFFIISFAAVIVQMIYIFFVREGGANNLVLSILVTLIAGNLVFFSRNAKAKGWLS
jgi:hypothetical protein